MQGRDDFTNFEIMKTDFDQLITEPIEENSFYRSIMIKFPKIYCSPIRHTVASKRGSSFLECNILKIKFHEIFLTNFSNCFYSIQKINKPINIYCPSSKLFVESIKSWNPSENTLIKFKQFGCLTVSSTISRIGFKVELISWLFSANNKINAKWAFQMNFSRPSSSFSATSKLRKFCKFLLCRAFKLRIIYT